MTCQKCLMSRTGDAIGRPCKTPGCDGTITEDIPFDQLVDRLPEPLRCGRRADSTLGDRTFLGPDYWDQFKSNRNRVCSYCGSLHPDDFFAIVKQAADAPEDADYHSVAGVEPSDKGYKIYAHQPGVRNAHEGGIKFYTHHLPRSSSGEINVTPTQNDEYSRAVKATRKRFDRFLAIRLAKEETAKAQ